MSFISFDSEAAIKMLFDNYDVVNVSVGRNMLGCYCTVIEANGLPLTALDEGSIRNAYSKMLLMLSGKKQ